jgi:hypothetical protein
MTTDKPKGLREPTLTPTVKLKATKQVGKYPPFRVYDMPSEVLNRFIKYTKEHAGNKAWVAIDQLLSYSNLSHRLDSLEENQRIQEKQNGNV